MELNDLRNNKWYVTNLNRLHSASKKRKELEANLTSDNKDEYNKVLDEEAAAAVEVLMCENPFNYSDDFITFTAADNEEYSIETSSIKDKMGPEFTSLLEKQEKKEPAMDISPVFADSEKSAPIFKSEFIEPEASTDFTEKHIENNASMEKSIKDNTSIRESISPAIGAGRNLGYDDDDEAILTVIITNLSLIQYHMSHLRLSNADLKAQMEKLKAGMNPDVKSAMEKAVFLEKANESLTKQVEELTLSRSESDKRVKASEEKIESVQAENDRLKADKERLSTELDKAREEGKKAADSEDFENLKNVNKELHSEIKKLQNQIKQAKTDNNRLRDKLKDGGENLSAKLRESEKTVADLRAEIKELNKKAKYVNEYDPITGAFSEKKLADDIADIDDSKTITYYSIPNLKELSGAFGFSQGNEYLGYLYDAIIRNYKKNEIYRFGAGFFTITDRNDKKAIEDITGSIRGLDLECAAFSEQVSDYESADKAIHKLLSDAAGVEPVEDDDEDEEEPEEETSEEETEDSDDESEEGATDEEPQEESDDSSDEDSSTDDDTVSDAELVGFSDLDDNE